MRSQLLLLALMCVMGMTVASESPAFLWGVNSEQTPALATVKQQQFAEMLAPLMKTHMVVTFVEENLSSKDFLCANSDGLSCYAYLQHASPKTYYTSVENPVEAVRSVAVERESNSINAEGKLVNPLNCQPGKAVFITFADRALAAHDAAIASITRMHHSCPTVYMYTSTPQNAVARRVRREVVASGGYVFRSGAQFLLYYKKLFFTQPDGDKRKAEELVLDSMSLKNLSNTNFEVTLSGAGKQLVFNMTSKEGYFVMSRLSYDNRDYNVQEIEAPLGFSYACGNVSMRGIIKKPDETFGGQLVWQGLQLQANFNSTLKADFKFGEPWSCEGFFSPGILMGLFVVTLMLAILFTGIIWMMDINTMDRFDDPKGKTITISATD